MNRRNDRRGEFHPGNPGFEESNPDQYGRPERPGGEHFDPTGRKQNFGRKQYGPQGEFSRQSGVQDVDNRIRVGMGVGITGSNNGRSVRGTRSGAGFVPGE